MENYSVAISFKDALGYIEYDREKKSASIVLDNEEGRTLADKFLHSIHEILIPHETLLDFTREAIDPLESLGNFKVALTKLWEETGIHVDWSRPVEYVKLHPHY